MEREEMQRLINEEIDKETPSPKTVTNIISNFNLSQQIPVYIPDEVMNILNTVVKVSGISIEEIRGMYRIRAHTDPRKSIAILMFEIGYKEPYIARVICKERSGTYNLLTSARNLLEKDKEFQIFHRRIVQALETQAA